MIYYLNIRNGKILRMEIKTKKITYPPIADEVNSLKWGDVVEFIDDKYDGIKDLKYMEDKVNYQTNLAKEKGIVIIQSFKIGSNLKADYILKYKELFGV